MQLNGNSENITIQHEVVKTNHVIQPSSSLQPSEKSNGCGKAYLNFSLGFQARA